MSGYSIVYYAATLGQFMLAAAMLLAFSRLIKGPRAQDRILAVDTLYNLVLLQTLVLAIKTGNPLYLPFLMIFAVVGFLSTIALAKFLMRGEVIE